MFGATYASWGVGYTASTNMVYKRLVVPAQEQRESKWGNGMQKELMVA